MLQSDDIIALATASGVGAIAVIRISGPNAISVVDTYFKSIHSKKLSDQKSHTIHLGHIMDGDKALDKVLVSVFKAPNSYTGENVVEISCHGSTYIQQQIIQLFIRKGCRMANPGEFTLRAFLNGKMDLSQAEAVADLINSDSAASHEIAMNQMRGRFSDEIKKLREELLNFASLIELELDFSQEDVEFANREQFSALLEKISETLKRLIDSFALGNVLKNGIPVAIVGRPNVGKSTLLNALLNEERAIVSEIEGTTRDSIEDQIVLGGITFRFIDTAGIRNTDDTVEKIGIKKTFEKIEQANLVVHMVDANHIEGEEIASIKKRFPNKKVLTIINKVDSVANKTVKHLQSNYSDALFIAAKSHEGVDKLKEALLNLAIQGNLGTNNVIVSNSRHYNALSKALEEIQNVKEGLSAEISSDLMAIDIRQALFHLGEITGSVSTDDLLGNIFSNFCIGK
ncbi:tRNA uridine-5-carboxymethylaminomethyl(34) synthesis GTPase MnmE [Allomuricauda sp. d1]|uniref:tRNA uridine-5-carboxymethylaminomethyl(34) synthesis GTPase MnmE n=1 Tax=Allomuricauda sp. d1 TaxID=3136725 RepID=UPI0031DD921E